MPAERRGQAIRVMIVLVNWQQEEPNGCGGGQQLLLNGTSRVNREIYARFCERLGVKFPGPTRRQWATTVPTATASRRQFRCRGLLKITQEATWAALSYNLTRWFARKRQPTLTPTAR